MKEKKLRRWRRIYELRQTGMSYAAIGREVKMDPKSVAYAVDMYIDKYIGYN